MSFDENVLDIDTGLAAPCGEARKVQTHAGEGAVDFGDKRFECRIVTEAVTAQSVRCALDPFNSIHAFREFDDRLMQQRGIVDGR